MTYADWLENGTDVWVARLGVPADLSNPVAAAKMRAGAPRSYESNVYAFLRPHVVTAGNDGTLMEKGPYGLTREGLRNIVRTQLPKTVAPWTRKRVLLYAHGGLVGQDSALQYVANYLPTMLEAQVYPIAFIWRSDLWTTIGNLLRDALSRRRDEGLLDTAKDFMLDRLDDTLEPLARLLGGKKLWDEMKENATGAAARRFGAARMTAEHLIALKSSGVIDEIHLVGHSAGAILLAPLAKFFKDQGIAIKSLSLWAPACTIDLFNDVYRPMIEDGDIETFGLYILDNATERDDNCAGIYHKSLLYLVRNALEAIARIPLSNQRDGTPLLGLERDVEKLVPKTFWKVKRDRIVAPGDPRSKAHGHSDFNDDEKTLLSTLQSVTGQQDDSLQMPSAFSTPTPRIAKGRHGLGPEFATQLRAP